MIKISVIMSVYNDEDNISLSVKSILEQTFKNLELLIINDSSTDSTEKILNKFANSDNRIKIFNNPKNIGLTKSLNILISKSRGEYIARQDSDDVSLPNRLEKQLQFISKKNLSGCSTLAFIKNTKKIIHSKTSIISPKLVLPFKNPFIHGTYLLNKKVLESVGNYDENFYFAQDYKLVNDLLNKKIKFKILKEPLYLLNQENNLSTKFKIHQDYYADCVRNGTIPNF